METFKLLLQIFTQFSIIAGIIIGIIQLVMLQKHAKANYEWNIRKMSLKYSGLYHPEVKKSKEILQEKFNLYGRKDPIPIDEILKCLEENNTIQLDFNNILTYYENISLACIKKIADEDVIFDMCGKTMVSIKRRLLNYIHYHREISNNERLWLEFEKYSRKFEERLSNVGAQELDKIL